VALAEFIAESPRLVRLDLRENDIKTAGLMALSLSLKVSQSVTRIDLDKEPKKESVSNHDQDGLVIKILVHFSL
jgi:protein phosphatase 1 regulatory subunit 37